jgi:hypothetical protein
LALAANPNWMAAAGVLGMGMSIFSIPSHLPFCYFLDGIQAEVRPQIAKWLAELLVGWMDGLQGQPVIRSPLPLPPFCPLALCPSPRIVRAIAQCTRSCVSHARLLPQMMLSFIHTSWIFSLFLNAEENNILRKCKHKFPNVPYIVPILYLILCLSMVNVNPNFSIHFPFWQYFGRKLRFSQLAKTYAPNAEITWLTKSPVYSATCGKIFSEFFH